MLKVQSSTEVRRWRLSQRLNSEAAALLSLCPKLWALYGYSKLWEAALLYVCSNEPLLFLANVQPHLGQIGPDPTCTVPTFLRFAPS